MSGEVVVRLRICIVHLLLKMVKMLIMMARNIIVGKVLLMQKCL